MSLLTQFYGNLIWYYRKDIDVALFSNLIYCDYSLYHGENVLVHANLILQTRRPQEVTATWCCLLRKNTHSVNSQLTSCFYISICALVN